MAAPSRLFSELLFEGADAAAFLQGYLTADLDELQEDVALPFALCNLKGRVVASGWCAGTDSRVRLVVHESVATALAEQLRKYLLFAKSKLVPLDTALRFSPTRLAGGLALPPVGWWVAEGDQDDGHTAFAAASAAASFVVVAQPVSESFLPQMLGLTQVGAVSFAKGCYLGQEVVARAEHRGEVKQKLGRYLVDGEPPQPGADALAEDGRKVGTVVALGSGTALCVTRSVPATADGAALSPA